MKRKTLFGIFLIVICMTLVGCGKEKEVNYDEGKALLNDEIIEKIEEEVIGTVDKSKLSGSYEYKVLSAANARINAGTANVQDVNKFTEVSVSSNEKYDNYNYRVYGLLIGKDDYNRTITKNYYIQVYCESQDDGSCEVEFGGLSIE